MKKTAIIIGAGYGGIALANLLGKAGYKVDVFEKNSVAGGRIHAVKKDGFTFDLGPSWYLMPEVFEQYYKLFGKSANGRLDLIRFTPGYKVFFENHPSILVQGDVKQDKQLFESIQTGAGKQLESYVERSSQAYALAVKYFLYNNFQRLRDVVKWPIIKAAPQMIGLVFQSLDGYVSRYFKDIRLKQLLEYHMVFLGSSPFQAPAIYTLMSHLDYKSGVFYPKKGMLSLVDDLVHLGKSYDITYHYNSPVEEIVVEDGRAIGAMVNQQLFKADTVVSNADLEFTETTLLPSEAQSFPKKYWQKRQPGPGALLISLGIKGELSNLHHHNLYFVNDWRENFDSIYVDKKVPDNTSIYICNPSKTDPGVAPVGSENVFILMPLPAGVDLTTQEENELVSRSIDILEKASGEDDIRSRIVSSCIFGPKDFRERFNAWQLNAFGGESHLLFQSIVFRTPNRSRKVKNLYYVGAGTLPGIGLPMCLISAQLTFKKITGNRTAGPLKEEDI